MPSKPLNARVRQALELYKQRLAAKHGSRIVEVRVFGSVARGEARAESDLDVLVLVDVVDAALHRDICFTAIDVYDELDLPWVITPLIMTADHFESLRRGERLLALEIDRDGVTV